MSVFAFSVIKMWFISGNKSSLYESLFLLVNKKKIKINEISFNKHKDGEIAVTQSKFSKKNNVLIQLPLDDPNETILNSVLWSKELGEKTKICLPYFPYTRNDLIFGEILKLYGNQIITLDIHNHKCIQQDLNIVNILPSSIFANYWLIKNKHINLNNVFVLAPDDGAAFRARNFAKQAKVDVVFAKKHRLSNQNCSITIPKLEERLKYCIIVDDIISSGQTMIGAIKALNDVGIINISIFATYLLPSLAENNMQALKNIFDYVDEIVTTDVFGIVKDDKITEISVAKLLYSAIES